MRCCLPTRRRTPPSRPPLRSPRHRQPPHPPSTSGSSAISSSFASTTAPFSTDFSSTSTASLASVRDLLPDGPIRYHFEEICLATDNFSRAKELARSVWRGVLRDTAVAISERQGDPRHFQNTLRMAHALHHGSLVKLLGGCRQRDHVYLVYEFMEGGNLRDCLRSRQASGYSALSSWHSRMQIAVDVAKGLEYLHHLTSPTFIHKHISSRNILVSNDRRAKIAHVGVSALTGESHQEIRETAEVQAAGGGEIHSESSSRRMTRVPSLKITGVMGYMPPEYRKTGEITPKYDVFAFGVVLSELLSGQEATLSVTDTLHAVMTDPDARGKLRLWMDPLLRDSYPLDDAWKLAEIVMSCVDPHPLKRPEMSDVALKLHRYLISAQKWEATMAVEREIMSCTLQPR